MQMSLCRLVSCHPPRKDEFIAKYGDCEASPRVCCDLMEPMSDIMETTFEELDSADFDFVSKARGKWWVRASQRRVHVLGGALPARSGGMREGDCSSTCHCLMLLWSLASLTCFREALKIYEALTVWPAFTGSSHLIEDILITGRRMDQAAQRIKLDARVPDRWPCPPAKTACPVRGVGGPEANAEPHGKLQLAGDMT